MSIDIATAANSPDEVTTDGTTVKAPPLGDLIKADQYLRAIDAAAVPGRNPFQMLYPARAVMPGSS
jgi:hypothetical protein